MANADLIRIQHMIDAAKEALSFADHKTKQDLFEDRMLALSIVKLIEIIGESAATVSRDFRETHREVPWAEIIAMRNRLIHVYFDIDLNRVWDTLSSDLPPLIATLKAIISAPL